MTGERSVLVYPDRGAIAAAVADRFVRTVRELLEGKPLANVALTGGSLGIQILAAINASPRRDEVDWSRICIWWGDERWVAEGHADRNDAQARVALLDHVALEPARVHAFPAADGPDDLDAAAQRYTTQLTAMAEGAESSPRFDITFLGAGPDGHIASLFPGREGIRSRETGAIAVRNSPKPPPERLSLTLPTINGSDRIWLCLAGGDKAAVLGLALAGAATVEVPVAGAAGRLETVFFVDQDAAVGVPQGLIARE